jgi:hypothetical protein
MNQSSKMQIFSTTQIKHKRCVLTRIVSHIANGKRKQVAEAIVIAWSLLLSWFCRGIEWWWLSILWRKQWCIDSTLKGFIYDSYRWLRPESTLRETRRANTLLKADKMPAVIGTTISFIPTVCVAFSSGSLPKLSVWSQGLPKWFTWVHHWSRYLNYQKKQSYVQKQMSVVGYIVVNVFL